MATRTVRLDAEAEKALQEVQDATGLPISEALKRGLRVLQEQVRRESARRPYDVYRGLERGPGGHSSRSSTTKTRSTRDALRRSKHCAIRFERRRQCSPRRFTCSDRGPGRPMIVP